MVEPRSAYRIEETFSLTASGGSTAIDCRYYSGGSYQLTWSGLTGTTGTIMPQVSNDGVTWYDLDNYWEDVAYTLSTAAGSQMWLVTTVPARYIRLYYTANGNTTGTSTLLWEGNRVDL